MKKGLKKGQAQIISVILIILLVLIAIIIVWGVIKKVVEAGSDDIGIEQFNINLRIQSVYIPSEGGSMKVKVHRASGDGNLSSIKFILKDSSGSQYVNIIEDPLPKELETFTYEMNQTLELMGSLGSAKFQYIKSVALSYGILNAKGNEVFINPSNPIEDLDDEDADEEPQISKIPLVGTIYSFFYMPFPVLVTRDDKFNSEQLPDNAYPYVLSDEEYIIFESENPKACHEITEHGSDSSWSDQPDWHYIVYTQLGYPPSVGEGYKIFANQEICEEYIL